MLTILHQIDVLTMSDLAVNNRKMRIDLASQASGLSFSTYLWLVHVAQGTGNTEGYWYTSSGRSVDTVTISLSFCHSRPSLCDSLLSLSRRYCCVTVHYRWVKGVRAPVTATGPGGRRILTLAGRH